MMQTVIDLTGQQFGKWLVLSRAGNDKTGRARWLCRCSCGVEKVRTANKLRQGITRQCLLCGKVARGRVLTQYNKTRVRRSSNLPQPPRYCTTPTDWETIGDEVLELAEQGVNRREIALRFNISKNAVAGWLNRNRDLIGYHPAPRDTPPTEIPEHLR